MERALRPGFPSRGCRAVPGARTVAVVAAVLAATMVPAARGLEIRDQTNPEVGEFLRVWAVHARAEMNPGFEPDAAWFGGVGWPFPEEWHRHYTLVSPRHFLGVAHYPPEVGWNLRFLGCDGVLRDHEVESVAAIEHPDGGVVDLFVGTLKEPVRDILPFAVIDSAAEVVGREVLVCGKAGVTVSATLDGLVAADDPGRDTRLAYFDFDPEGGDPADIHYESGDSGSPVFRMVDGKPVLFGLASDVKEVDGMTRSLMTLIPAYLDEIDALMEPAGHRLIRAGAESPVREPETRTHRGR